ncbi:MAG TPA: PP0621 family protein [Candidatus Binatia bacterium]|nr:PP0621 family protein [Candidatus Binatia bacterium]
MSLLRLLFFLLICWMIWSALRAFVRGLRQKPPHRNERRADGEEMVLDPQCHSYVPKSAAVLESGQYFCSQECARLYLSR